MEEIVVRDEIIAAALRGHLPSAVGLELFGRFDHGAHAAGRCQSVAGLAESVVAMVKRLVADGNPDHAQEGAQALDASPGAVDGGRSVLAVLAEVALEAAQPVAQEILETVPWGRRWMEGRHAMQNLRSVP